MNIGSIWHRWDLHYHTPSSYDYKNKAKTNEVLVQELILNISIENTMLLEIHRLL